MPATRVAVTNVRFGFVDTAMAKSDVKPFMITADRAARVIEKCIVRRPIRKTVPLRMAALWLRRTAPPREHGARARARA